MDCVAPGTRASSFNTSGIRTRFQSQFGRSVLNATYTSLRIRSNHKMSTAVQCDTSRADRFGKQESAQRNETRKQIVRYSVSAYERMSLEPKSVMTT